MMDLNIDYGIQKFQGCYMEFIYFQLIHDENKHKYGERQTKN